MGSPYLGEIRMFGGSFAPVGWALCDGQLLPIDENSALYNLLGTTYGGDGVTTFGVPNLASRAPIHVGTGGGATYIQGQSVGVEQVTLTIAQIPSHSHVPECSTVDATSASPTGNVPAVTASLKMFSPATTPNIAMAASALASVGGNLPHDNMPPFLAISFIIALEGAFPSSN